jgi:hypothetical protein
MALLLANLVNLSRISTMGSSGFLIIFAIVNAANMKMSGTVGSSRWIAGTGLVACLAAIVVLVGHALRNDPLSLVFLIAMIALAAAIEGVYMKSRKQPDRQSRVREMSSQDGESRAS